MNAAPDLATPTLAVVASNPVPEGAKVGMFETTDRVKLRYATFPKGGGARTGHDLPRPGAHRVHREVFRDDRRLPVARLCRRHLRLARAGRQPAADPQPAARLRRHVRRLLDRPQELPRLDPAARLPAALLSRRPLDGRARLASMRALRDRMMFERIFLSARRWSGSTASRFRIGGMARLAETLSLIGLGQMPVGRRADKPPTEASFAGNPITSDHGRYMRMLDIMREARRTS